MLPLCVLGDLSLAFCIQEDTALKIILVRPLSVESNKHCFTPLSPTCVYQPIPDQEVNLLVC